MLGGCVCEIVRVCDKGRGGDKKCDIAHFG